jgi:hypothetical protein
MRGRSVSALAVALTVALLATAGAQAVYSTGFEAPLYGTGSVVGQDNWAAGSGVGAGQGVIDTFAQSGSQSLMWDTGTALTSFYSVRHAFDGQNGAIAAGTPLEISTWFYVDPASGPDRLTGLYATNSGVGTLGSTSLGLTIDGDGGVRAGTTWAATYTAVPLHTDPALVGGWIRAVLTYDGIGGGAALYDGGANLLWSTSFAAVTLGNSNGAGLASWNINLGFDYVGTVDRLGKSYVDDLVIRVVPEPASALALGLGLLLLAGRRR